MEEHLLKLKMNFSNLRNNVSQNSFSKPSVSQNSGIDLSKNWRFVADRVKMNCIKKLYEYKTVNLMVQLNDGKFRFEDIPEKKIPIKSIKSYCLINILGITNLLNTTEDGRIPLEC